MRKSILLFILMLISVVLCCMIAACSDLSFGTVEDSLPDGTLPPVSEQTEEPPLPAENGEGTEETPTEPIHSHIYSEDWSSDEAFHWHEAICGHDVTTEKTPHLWDEGTVTTPATENNEGEKTYLCTLCGAKRTEVIEPLPHRHVFTDWVTEDAPTCTEDGAEVRRCACEETERRAIPATGHTVVADPAVPPTCTGEGRTAGSHCSVCGEILVRQETIPAKGHAYGDYQPTKDPTCTEAGEESRSCADCSAIETRNIDPLGHEYAFDSFVWTEHTAQAKCVCSRDTTHVEYRETTMRTETVEGTCETPGTLRFIATYDGHTDDRIEYFEIVGHDYLAVVTPSTCTAGGYTTYTCSRCEDSYADDYTDSLGHDYAAVVTSNTCTEGGYTTYTCTRCTSSYTDDYTEPFGHDYTFRTFLWDGYTATAEYVCAHDETHVLRYDATVMAKVTTAPACEKAGVRTYTATYDGKEDVKSEDIDALGHTYGTLIAEVPATCIAVGTKAHYRCSACEKLFDTTKTETTSDALLLAIDPTAHDLTKHEAKAVGCTTIGWDAYDTCSRCTYTTYRELPTKGHAYGEYSTTIEPTCTECGEEKAACSACGDVRTRTLAALGHSYNATVTPPTCTTDGYTTYACIRCEDYNVDDHTDALGHDLTEHLAKAPTCTEEGNAAYATCSRCNYSTYAAIPAKGHAFDEDGLCTVCGSEAPPTEGLVFAATGDGNYRVSGYVGDSTDVFVPRRYSGSPVTKIDAAAFAGTDVISVFLSPNVQTIESGAFAGCSSLTNLTLPFIGGTASANTASASTLFGYIFGSVAQTGCTETKQYYSSTGYAIYHIPDSLRTVTVTGGNVLYGAFYGCTSLTSVTIKGAATMGKCVFAGCSALEELTLPFVGERANVGTMDNHQYPLGSLFGTESYANTAYILQYYYDASPFMPVQTAYYIPASLRRVTVTGGKILYGAFSGIITEMSVTLADGVTSIENAAFAGAEGLINVTLAKSIAYFGNDVFSECTALTDLHYKGTTTEWTALSKAADWAHDAPAFTVHCTDGDLLIG